MIFDFLKRKTEREKVRLFSEVSKIALEDEVHSLIASEDNLYVEGLQRIVTIRDGRIISRKDFVEKIGLYAADTNYVYLSYCSGTRNEILKMEEGKIASNFPIEGHVRGIKPYGNDLYISINKDTVYSIIAFRGEKVKWRFDTNEYIHDFVINEKGVFVVANRTHFLTLRDGTVYSEFKLNKPVEEMVFLRGDLYAISGTFGRYGQPLSEDRHDISVIIGDIVIPKIRFESLMTDLITDGKYLYVRETPYGSKVFTTDGKRIVGAVDLKSDVGSIAVDNKHLYAGIGKEVITLDSKWKTTKSSYRNKFDFKVG